MHKGRFAPRVKDQVLSEDVLVPYFAPVKIRPGGFLDWDGDLWDVEGSDWAEASVDPAHLAITWGGEVTVRGKLFVWEARQSRDGLPTPLRLHVVWVASDFATFTVDFLPDVAAWKWDEYTAFAPGTYTETGTGSFVGWGNQRFHIKGWR